MYLVAWMIGVIFLLIAWLVGVKRISGLIAGVNTANEEQKAKMNLPAICRTMGIVFAVLGGVFLLAGALDLLGLHVAVESAFAALLIGIWFMVLYIQRFDGNNYDEAGRPKKRLRIINIGVSLLMSSILLFAGLMCAATLRNPAVTFSGDRMIIEGLYGTSLAKTEVKDVSLLEEPLTLLDKTNGSALLGVFKGNFTSDELGAALVYVRDSSSPWICIRREGAPVLLCLSSASDTVALYERIVSWVKG